MLRPSLAPDLNLITRRGEWTGSSFMRKLVLRATLVGSVPFTGGQGVANHG